MIDLIQEILETDEDTLELALQAVIKRYAVLFPEWEVSTISIEKRGSRTEQIDRMIAVLETIKRQS